MPDSGACARGRGGRGRARIMMDNMEAPRLSQALALVPPDIEAEVSGGVRLETIRAIALTGRAARISFPWVASPTRPWPRTSA